MDERVKVAMEALLKAKDEVQLSPFLRERVMASAKRIQSGSPAHSKRVRVGWTLAAAFLLLFSTGFAAMSLYKIKNNEGETIHEYQAAPPLSKERLTELQQMQEERDKIQQMLKPGTAAAVYQVKKDGQSDFFYMDNPLVIARIDTLQSLTKDILRYPVEVAKDYTFVDASVRYDYEKDESLYEEMKRKAEETKQVLLIQPVKTLPAISHVTARYEDEAGNILRINLLKKFWVGKSKLTVPGVHHAVENVSVNGHEGLFVEREDPFGKLRKELEWMEGEWSISINSTDESMTKEQLLDIASRIR